MIPTASTAAWALHDLGLATSFGGSLFGRMALNPAAGRISDTEERGELVHSAWHRFSLLNLLSHVGIAATWFTGRAMLTGKEIDATTRNLVKAKDALVALSVVSGVTGIVAGERARREPELIESSLVDVEGKALEKAAVRTQRAEKVASVAGVINLVSLAGILGVTAVLAMKAGDSRRWPSVQKKLP